MSAKKGAKKNPLYVVTADKKGSVVEEASGLFDLVIKRLGLGDALELLQELFQRLMGMVTSYALFVSVKKVIDDLTRAVIELFGLAAPKAPSA